MENSCYFIDFKLCIIHLKAFSRYLINIFIVANHKRMNIMENSCYFIYFNFVYYRFVFFNVNKLILTLDGKT